MVNFKELQVKFKGKKVFLTGHTGFKGSWMLKVFQILGAEVKGYSLEPEENECLYNLIKGSELCESVIADIRDRQKLINEINQFCPDFIFHLAAQPLVRNSYEFPSQTFDINVTGTVNLMEAVRHLQNKCSVVIITTDKVYHNHEWEYPYRENDRLGGFDPYSSSKACVELIIDSYRNSFFNTDKIDEHKIGISVARAGNVIGGGDWSKDRLFPDIVKCLNSGKPVTLRSPNSIRPWQHVLEPVLGYLNLGKSLEEEPIKFSKAFNFGPDTAHTITVENILKIAINIWGKGDYIVEKSANNLHEAGILKLDISKAKLELNWIPQLTPEESVALTIDWYKSFFANKEDIENITRNQIFDFLKIPYHGSEE